MRRIILSLSASLDGFFEGPNRELDWSSADEELLQHFNDWLKPVSALLQGRVTYERLAAYWPTAHEDPQATPATLEFAGIWREVPKLVYSKTLREAGWNGTVVREVVPEEVMALKAQPGGDMVVGGPNLASSFLRLGLVDAVRLYFHPVAIGHGHPLFRPEALPLRLRLTGTRTFGSGVVMLDYERVMDAV